MVMGFGWVKIGIEIHMYISPWDDTMLCVCVYVCSYSLFVEWYVDVDGWYVVCGM